MKKTKTSTPAPTPNTEPITADQYLTFQAAYDFFNAALFGGGLPHVLIVLQRKAKSYGYFAAKRFRGRATDATAHELALNPDLFTGHTDEEILSTLAHEMAHVWQHTHGTPGRPGYHNQQWALKMKEIGLQPSHTGKPGGKETGQSVSHYIIPGGRYAEAYAQLQAAGVRLHWQSAARDNDAKGKAQSKTKFTCPQCKTNVWGAPPVRVVCEGCSQKMVPTTP
jgi:hypothetical protein